MASQNKIAILKKLVSVAKENQHDKLVDWQRISKKLEEVANQSAALDNYMQNYNDFTKGKIVAGLYQNKRSIIDMVSKAKTDLKVEYDSLLERERSLHVAWLQASQKLKGYEDMLTKKVVSQEKSLFARESKDQDDMVCQRYIRNQNN